MARAKRTDRAEARRRYRAASATDPTDVSEEAAARPAGTPRTGSPAPPVPKSTGTPPRMNMATAFRESFRPLNVREDIAALPWIALNTKALWVPLLITIASTVAVIATGASNFVTAFVFAYFVQTPAIGGVFIAGFLAPRASWLLGVIVGLVAAIGYSIYIVIAARTATPVPEEGVVREAVISALILSPILGAFFAASAAWYRRFLSLSNPNRGRRPAAAAKKVGDGRTRGGGNSQKAGARR